MDVWLGNSRGNIYSQGHQHYDKNDKAKQKAYWDFSWTEIGRHDIPVVIRYVKEQTQTDKMAYVGYSQGTIQMFYGLTTNQKFFQEHISVFVALAPCALIGNASTAASLTANNMYWVVENFTGLFNLYHVKHPDYHIELFKYDVCSMMKPLKSIAPNLCDWSLTRAEAKV